VRSTLGGSIALLLALGAPSPAAAERPFVVRSPADWVEDLAPPDVPRSAEGESDGRRYLLFDQQVRAGGGTQEVYYRTAWRIETTAGLQDASEIEMSYEPSFERLVLHHARVLRGGRPVWSFSPAEVRIAHTEEDLEARLYNDERTATIFVKGLRVGDTVDCAYTLEGANPVLGGRFDAVLWFEFSAPVDRVRRRLVWRGGAPLHLRARGAAPEPTTKRTPDGIEYAWEVRGSHASSREERTPAWFQPEARVEVSSFDGWADVARRSRELFAAVDAGSPAIDALLRDLRLEGAAADARVDRAVRFVQDEVRYLGLEMGPHSHQPHTPADTLERRFGDCKDKSALLVSVLRRLGVPAWPALVSTTERQALDERLPGLFAFDHVIVAVETGGGLVFVDATASEQGGPVRSRRPPRFARALVLRDDCVGLTTIPRPPLDVPSVEVAETYSVARWNTPARLEVVTTYRGDDADDTRQSQARSTRAEVGKKYRDFYAEEHPGIRALSPPRVEDDRERNVVVVREEYEIPTLWQEGAHEFRAWLVDSKLVRPRLKERAAPWALRYPDLVRHLLRIRLPGPPDVAPLRESVKTPEFALDATWSVRGNEARLDYTYRSLRESVEPGDVAGFVDRVDRAADLVLCRVPARPPGQPVAGPVAVRAASGADRVAGWIGLATIGGGALAFLAWGAHAAATGWRARRRRSEFTSRVRPRLGEQPLRAILVNGPDSIRREGLGGACGCGGPWREVERATVTFEGRPMTVVTRRCDSCAGEKTLYYRTG
jgi:transglutaminase-like putative cysteine protease